MRSRFPVAFALVAAAIVLSTGLAQAERRIFVVANNADGYGVDRCLATGARCGAPVAAAYCKSQAFAHAGTYRKVDKDDITGAIPNGPACAGGGCDEYVAIECSR